jgi:hypothetical protein
MNAKKAKRLRREVREVASSLPAVAHRIHTTGPLEGTVIVDPMSQRGGYKLLKKRNA